MTTQQLAIFQKRRPFDAYAIHLADGRSINVLHPENLSSSMTGRTIGVVNADKVVEVVDMLLVTSLRPLPRR